MEVFFAVLILAGGIALFTLPWLLLWRFTPSQGEAGERDVARRLKKLPKEKYIILNDVTIPTANGKTTQIDHIVLSLYGVFVIETKTYSGWIYGGEESENWTSINRYGEKYQFYNPILQNAGHIRALKSLLSSHDVITFFPIVAFAGSGTLKVNVSNSIVIYSNEILSVIKQVTIPKLTWDQMNEIAQRIISRKLDFKEINATHLANVQEAKIKKSDIITSGRCPRCGGYLVKRQGSYGSFYGCSNYPHCKFTCNQSSK